MTYPTFSDALRLARLARTAPTPAVLTALGQWSASQRLTRLVVLQAARGGQVTTLEAMVPQLRRRRRRVLNRAFIAAARAGQAEAMQVLVGMGAQRGTQDSLAWAWAYRRGLSKAGDWVGVDGGLNAQRGRVRRWATIGGDVDLCRTLAQGLSPGQWRQPWLLNEALRQGQLALFDALLPDWATFPFSVADWDDHEGGHPLDFALSHRLAAGDWTRFEHLLGLRPTERPPELTDWALEVVAQRGNVAEVERLEHRLGPLEAVIPYPDCGMEGHRQVLTTHRLVKSFVRGAAAGGQAALLAHLLDRAATLTHSTEWFGSDPERDGLAMRAQQKFGAVRWALVAAAKANQASLLKDLQDRITEPHWKDQATLHAFNVALLHQAQGAAHFLWKGKTWKRLELRYTEYAPLIHAVKGGQRDWVERILTVPSLRQNSVVVEALKTALKHQRLDLYELLLPHQTEALDERQWEDLLDKSLDGRLFGVLRTLLQQAPVKAQDSFLSTMAVRKLDKTVWKAVLDLEDRALCSRALIKAVTWNLPIDLASILVPWADARLQHSEALYLASRNGNEDWVRALIPVSEPLDDWSRALRLATQKQHWGCVALLLPHSDPTHSNAEAWLAAVQAHHAPTLAAMAPLMGDRLPAAATLLEAVKGGHAPLVTQWLDPVDARGRAIALATAATLACSEPKVYLPLMAVLAPRSDLDAAADRLRAEAQWEALDLLAPWASLASLERWQPWVTRQDMPRLQTSLRQRRLEQRPATGQNRRHRS